MHTHIHMYCTQKLVGDVGLLMTNHSPESVEAFFEQHTVSDYARAGSEAPDDFLLEAGPLEQFPHNMETQLRTLGLPTVLKKSMSVFVSVCVCALFGCGRYVYVYVYVSLCMHTCRGMSICWLLYPY